MTTVRTVRSHSEPLRVLLRGLLARTAGDAPPAAAESWPRTCSARKKLPAATAAEVLGFYSKGCFSGGVAIATDGPNWQAMRLSRNRRWGHPTMIALIEKLRATPPPTAGRASCSATSRSRAAARC